MRARDFGVVVGAGTPGRLNAITDVAGVRVGHRTLIEGDGPLRVGSGPVRTGVTVIQPGTPHPWQSPVFAGFHRLNGAGEMTGVQWIAESGRLTSPIGLTNTHSVGVAHEGLVRIEGRAREPGARYFSLPVAAETWDGMLNDINGFHVREEHVLEAYESATDAGVLEGNVGGGTGMICHGFKGGIGTASRVVAENGFTVGVLVQANHGRRDRLQVNGIPVGRILDESVVPLPQDPAAPPQGSGSIITIVATDAPLLPHQLDRLAQRAALGIGRLGGAGENLSGDLTLAFSTGNLLPGGTFADDVPLTWDVRMMPDAHIVPLFYAVIEATEEAIVNALVAAETMTGRDGITVHALAGRRLAEIVGGET